MKSHRLRHRVSIQRRVETDDPVAGRRSTWVDVATDVPAGIEPLSVREFASANQVHGQLQARIVMRWRDDIDPTMRIVHGEVIYDIAGVLPDAKSGREHITIPVIAGVNAG